MDPDRLEKLMVQVLSEVRDLRQTTVTTWVLKAELQELEARLDAKIDAKIDGLRNELNARIDGLAHDINDLSRDLKLTQLAVMDTAREVKCINAKIDNHATRLDHLEGAAQ